MSRGATVTASVVEISHLSGRSRDSLMQKMDRYRARIADLEEEIKQFQWCRSHDMKHDLEQRLAAIQRILESRKDSIDFSG